MGKTTLKIMGPGGEWFSERKELSISRRSGRGKKGILTFGGGVSQRAGRASGVARRPWNEGKGPEEGFQNFTEGCKLSR